MLGLVAGLDEPDAGTIAVGGETSPAGRLAHCALMPQRDCLLPWRSALDNACLALENQGQPRAEARRRAAPLFTRFALAGAESLRPVRLSGGMRQRVAFSARCSPARTSCCSTSRSAHSTRSRAPSCRSGSTALLAVEPRTVLLVTHDVEEALLVCDRVIVLSDGRVTAELDVDLPRDRPRREVVTDRFVALRETALEAIA